MSLFIYKYDPDSGEDIFADRKDLTQSEINNLRTTFAVADLEVGDEIKILATANISIPQSVTEMEEVQMAMFGVEITDYNGTFNQVTTGALRSEGFAMFGEAEATISDKGFTPIDLLLINLCSKVSFKLSLSDTFSEKYPGNVRVNNISVRNTPTTLYDLFSGNILDYYHLQETVALDNIYQNQFYLFYSQPTFTVDATYDIDGDFTTKDDQTPMKYKIEIKDEYGSNVNLEPSTYWRINGKINGLNGTGVVLSIVSGDWMSAKSYDIEL
ncbi:MAG: hypothetical protein R3Y50_10220 [Rikenellaceae bacterium]